MARFDTDTLLGCVARIVTKDKFLIDQFHEHLSPETLFPANPTKEQEGIKKLFKFMLDHRKDNTWKDVSLETLASQTANMPDGEMREVCMSLVSKMQTDKKIHAKASDEGCMHLFMDFLKVSAIENWAKGFSREFQKGNINESIRQMKDFIPQLDKISFRDYNTMNPDTLYDRLINRSENALVNNMKCGIKALDGETGIGFYEPGTLNVFAGPPGSGKSMMTVSLVYQALKQRKYVHLTCVEDREQTFENRLLSALTGIPIFKIKYKFKELTSAEDELIRRAIVSIKQYLRVDYMYGCSAEFIQKEIESINSQRRFSNEPEYEVDILDYTGHIAESCPGDKKHDKLRTAYSIRKNFALKTGKFVFDFVQINREGDKKTDGGSLLRASDFAGAFDIAQVCDTIITLNKPQNFPQDNMYKFHVAKGREGGTGLTIEVPANFESGRFELDKTETMISLV